MLVSIECKIITSEDFWYQSNNNHWENMFRTLGVKDFIELSLNSIILWYIFDIKWHVVQYSEYGTVDNCAFKESVVRKQNALTHFVVFRVYNGSDCEAGGSRWCGEIKHWCGWCRCAAERSTDVAQHIPRCMEVGMWMNSNVTAQKLSKNVCSGYGIREELNRLFDKATISVSDSEWSLIS